MSGSLYHSLLRVSALTTAFVLLFVSGVVHPVTTALTSESAAYMASVMQATASVPSNGINDVTAELQDQRQALAEREQVIAEREIELGLRAGTTAADYSSWILSALLFVLLVLIVLNYILDFLRSHPLPTPRATQ